MVTFLHSGTSEKPLNPVFKAVILGLIPIIFLVSHAKATQLSGTYTINPSGTASATVFNDFGSAITYMTSTNSRSDGGPSNSGTVGVSGPVLFKVASGTTYTLSSALTIPAITGASSANAIAFRKNGSGANPLINGYTGTGTADGIVILQGASYITFDGIDLKDPSSNTTTTTEMEWGYALLRTPSTVVGSQNDTIKNCTITLNNSNTNTIGIYSDCYSWSSGVLSAVTPASATGTNSNNKFYGNTITKCFLPIYISGFNNGSVTFFDINNDAGSVAGNTITTFGYMSNNGPYSSSYPFANIIGILFYQQGGTYSISNNNITLTSTDNISTTGGIEGIASTAVNYSISGANPTIKGNTISLISTALSGQFYGIGNNQGNSLSTVDIENNTISCSNATATGALNFAAINTADVAGTSIYSGNEIKNCTIAGTGTFYGITTSNSWGGQPSGTVTISGNKIHDNMLSGTSSSQVDMYLIYIPNANSPVLIESNNQIYNNSNKMTQGNVFGIWNSATTLSENIYGNAIYSLSNTCTAGVYNSTLSNSVSVTGIYTTGNTTTRNIYQDSIYSLSSPGGFVQGIQNYIGTVTNLNIFRNKIYGLSQTSSPSGSAVMGIQVQSGTTANISNNFIGNLTTTSTNNSANGIMGIIIQTPTSANLYYNTIYLNNSVASPNSAFGAQCIYLNTSTTCTLNNNLLYNTSIPGSGGYSSCLSRNGIPSSTWSTSSNNNLYYAGAGSTNYMYWDGTTKTNSLTTLQSTASPRESASVTENVSFISTTGSNANFLRITPGTASKAESGGISIAGYSDDYDAINSRLASNYPLSGQSNGGGKAPDIGADEYDGTPGSMSYLSSNVVQVSPGGAVSGANQAIIQIVVTTNGVTSALSATSFTLNANGTTAIGDINGSNAKLYYTGSSNTFSTSTSFGSATLPSSTSTAYNITGSQTLTTGNNYFWLAYDISSGSTPCHSIDAECTSITVTSVRTPATTAPAGTSHIAGVAAGTYTIGGISYPTIASAFTALACGSSGNVIFNVPAGYTETAANLSLSGVSNVTFRKSGAGANPKITASTGTGLPTGAASGTFDGIIILSGCTDITFNGIDLAENASNNTITKQMEWGYALLRTSGTVTGCQYDTIKNCKITLNRSNTYSIGIYSDVYSISSGALTGVTVSAMPGTNSYNKFYGDTINNCFLPVYILGYNSSSIISDVNNDVGSVAGNVIYNFGYLGNTGPYTSSYPAANVIGIFLYQQGGTYYINNNTITLTATDNISTSIEGISSQAVNYGIPGSNPTIKGNTINIVSTATSGNFYGIGNNQGSTASASDIENNTIIFSNTVASGAVTFYGINEQSSITSGSYVINGNEIKNCSISGTGSFYGISTAGAGTPTSSTVSMSYNKIHDNTLKTSGGGGVMDPVYNPNGSSVGFTASHNQIYNDSNKAGGGFIGIYNNVSTTSISINNDSVYACYSNGNGAMNGIYASNTTTSGTTNINNNAIYSIASTGTGNFFAIYSGGSGATTENINGNNINSISNNGADIAGIYTPSNALTKNISQDSIYAITDNSTSNSNAFVQGIINQSTLSGSIVNINRCKIYNLYDSIATSSALQGVYGMQFQIGSSSTTVYNIYNNFIAGLRINRAYSLVSGSGYPSYLGSLIGVWFAAGATMNLDYNTIYLNETATSAGFGSACVSVATSGQYSSANGALNFTMNNNILVNLSGTTASTPTGYNAAFIMGTAAGLSQYQSSANYNDFYVGANASNYIYYDGTNAKQDICGYQALVSPRDANAFAENPPFISFAGPGTLPASSNNWLFINPATASLTYKGGIAVSGVTTDYSGNARASTPCVGAEEFTGTVAPYAYVCSNAYQVSPGTTLTTGGTGQAILKIAVQVNGSSGTPPSISSFTINANGTTVIADVTKAYIYSTGSSSTFSTGSLFGSTTSVSTSNFSISGTPVALSTGINYFWLAYDISSSTGCDVIDGECTSININSTAKTPSITAPVGTRFVTSPITAGTYTIGSSGTFPSLATAFIALNSCGIAGSGNVVFKIAAGYTETLTAPLTLNAISGASSSSTLTFKKDPATSGANPLITAYTGLLNGAGANITAGDAMVVLNGASFITFDGIDLQDNSANTTLTTMMEMGYWLQKASSTVGSQYDTIRNCTVTLQSTNTNYTYGIASHCNNTGNTTVAPSTFAGTNSYNQFDGNTINNCIEGIFFVSTSPINDVGNVAGATKGNKINMLNATGPGSGSSNSNAILAQNQTGISIQNNTISGSFGTNTTLPYGIFLNGSDSINATYPVLNINNNTITLTANAAAAALIGISTANVRGSTYTMNINNNVIHLSNANATTGSLTGIINASTVSKVYIKGNTVSNCSLLGSSNGTFTGIAETSTGTLSLSTLSKNTVSNITKTSSVATATGTMIMYKMNSVTGMTMFFAGNKAKNCSIAGGTGALYGLQLTSTSAPTSLNIYADTLTTLSNYGTGTVLGINNACSPATFECHHSSIGNFISQSTATTAPFAAIGIYTAPAAAITTESIDSNALFNIITYGAGNAAGIYQNSSVSATTRNIFLDSIYSITSYGGLSYGIFNTLGTTLNFYANKVNGINSFSAAASTTSNSTGISLNGATTTANIYNNIIAGIYAPASTSTPFAVSGLNISNTSGTVNVYYNTIYLDATAGISTSFSTAGIYAVIAPTTVLRNNIIINNSGVGATATTGSALAYKRSAALSATYSTSSNNNLLYAGSVFGPNRYIYGEGTTATITNGKVDLASFKTYVTSSREANSVTEVAPILSYIGPNTTAGTSSRNWLHLSTALPTQAYLGGSGIAGYSTDIDGNARSTSSSTCMGAAEFSGTAYTTPFILGSTVTQLLPGTSVGVSATDSEIVKISVYVTGPSGTLNAKSFAVDAFGTSNIADLTKAKIYYTGSTNTFSTTTLFGSTTTPTIAKYSIRGTQSINTPGYYYFWLTYAIGSSPGCDILDGACDSITTNNGVISSIQVPLVTAPVGNRPVNGSGSIAGGTDTIGTTPGFATIASTIARLNNCGLTGNIVFKVPAGWRETASNLSIPALSYSVTFQKMGGGVNPRITAGTGTGASDGIIIFNGANNVTFDGIDLYDSSSNTNSTTQMEWGYALLKASASIGSQNITIKNCTIQLQNSNSSTVGIYSDNRSPASSTQLTVTSSTGTNSNNKFYKNTISHCFTGIFINGFISTSYSLCDANNDVGSGSGNGNTISSFGYTSTTNSGYTIATLISVPVTGIWLSNQVGSYYVSNNTITLSASDNVSATVTGISSKGFNTIGATPQFLATAAPTLTGNTINMTTVSSAGTTIGIFNNMSQPVGTGSGLVDIENNNITMVNTTATGVAPMYGIDEESSPWSLKLDGNTINNCQTTGTGAFAGIRIVTGSPQNSVEMSGNTVSNITRAVANTSGDMYGIQYGTTNAGVTLTESNNKIFNIANTSTTAVNSGGIYGIYNSSTSGTENIYGNAVYSLTTTASSATSNVAGIYTQGASTTRNIYQDSIYSLSSYGGFVYGIRSSGTVATFNIYRNKIYGLSQTASPSADAIYGINITTGTTVNISNNILGNFTTTATNNSANGIVGIILQTPTYAYVYYNTIYLNNTVSSPNASFGSQCIYANTGTNLTLNNNILVNTSIGGGTGVSSCLMRSGTPTSSWLTTSNNNLFYAGGGTNNYIYWDNTTKTNSLSAYQSLVSPRDAASVSENPPFITTSGAGANFLHLNPVTASLAESGGTQISGYVDDYDATNTRPASGYPLSVQAHGGGTAPDIGADEYDGTPSVMTYVSSTVAQAASGSAVAGAKQAILQITVVTSGAASPLLATSFSLNANGTGSISDINSGYARLYYTGASSTFSTASLFDSSSLPSSTSATFTITGSQALSPGTNYFWLTYDISSGATSCDNIDGECTSITIASSAKTPTITAPAGTSHVSGVLGGTYTIGGSAFPTIASAFTAINNCGASGIIVFNVPAGYTETASNLYLNNVSNITFQKSGTGTNPKITASTGTGLPTGATTGTYDGMIILQGCSNMTFNGIDLAESGSNSSGTTQMEWGYALLKTSATAGCQNITIKNCKISLNRTNLYTHGIYADNYNWSNSTQAMSGITPTAFSGTNSNNKFYSDTITNCFTGIYLQGYGVNTVNLFDVNNDIGSGSGHGNVINSFGYASNTSPYSSNVNAIYTQNQSGTYYISNNIITLTSADNISNTSGTLLGIYSHASVAIQTANPTITGNTINLTSTATSGNIYPVYNNMSQPTGTGSGTVDIENNVITVINTSATAALNTFCIEDESVAWNIISSGNTIKNCRLSGSPSFIGMRSASTPQRNLTYQNNSIFNNVLVSGSTGTMYGIQYSNGSASIVLTEANNKIYNDSNNGTGNLYGIYNSITSGSEAINGNSIYSLSTAVASSGNQTIGINTSAASTNRNIYQDTIYNISAVGGFAIGIQCAGTATALNIYQNKIYNIAQTNSTTGSAVYGMSIGSSTTVNVWNNLVANLTVTSVNNSANGIIGIILQSPTTANVYYNSVYLNNTVTPGNTTFGNQCLYVNTTTNLILNNNILVNTSIGGSSGLATAFGRSSTTIASYQASSNNNLLYVGSGANNYLFYDGTNKPSTISAYKTLMSTRDQASVSELPPFISTSGSNANFLRMVQTIPTYVESGGIALSSPYNVDYFGNARGSYPLTGQLNGGGKAPDMGAVESDGTPPLSNLYSSSTASQVTGSISGGATKQAVIQLNVTTTTTGLPTYNPASPNATTGTIVTGIKVNANGTTHLGMISNARIYYTATSTFATTTQFGSTVASPTSSDFTVSGSLALATGAGNYFWLTYDVNPAGAACGDVIDGEMKGITVSQLGGTPSISIGSSVSTQTPTITAPSGSRSLVVAGLSTRHYVNDNSSTGDVYTASLGSNSNSGTACLPYGTIAYAITQASAGDTIYLDAGKYYESDITVTKKLTFIGAGTTLTYIGPGVSSVSSAATFPSGAHHGFLVQHSSVKIKNITLDGELQGGPLGNSLSLQYHNGIVTDYRVANYDTLVVDGVVIKHVYWRGAYARGGSVSPSKGHVFNNILVDSALNSYALLTIDASGTISNCTVNYGSYGIANGSAGTFPLMAFTNNTVNNVQNSAYSTTNTAAGSVFSGNKAFWSASGSFNKAVGVESYGCAITFTNDTFTNALYGYYIYQQNQAYANLLIGSGNSLTGLIANKALGSAAIYADGTITAGSPCNFSIGNIASITNYRYGVYTAGTTDVEFVNSPSFGTNDTDIYAKSYIHLQHNLNISNATVVDSGGTLAYDTFAITGTGNIRFGSSTLILGSAFGISASGSNGNIQTSGTRSFSNMANFTFSGSTAQVTGSGMPSVVHDMYINNAAGVALSRNLQVNDSLVMITGDLNTTLGGITDTLILGSAAYLKAESVSGSVIGRVKTTRSLSNTNVQNTFGNIGIDITIPISGTNPGTTTVVRSTGAFAVGTPVLKHNNRTYSSINRIFKVLPSNNGGLHAQMVFHYLTTELNGVPESGLDFFRHGDNYTAGLYGWKGVDSRNGASHYLSLGNVSTAKIDSFSSWTAGGFAVPLPVELISFDARLMNATSADLAWSTASELNNDHFDVERSENGVNFTKVGEKHGHGTIQDINNYDYLDQFGPGILSPVLYYRLKQLDFNGTATYSDVRKVILSAKQEGVKAWYDRDMDKLRLSITVNSDHQASLKVIDATAKVVTGQSLQLSKGSNAIQLDMQGLANGIYTLIYTTGQEVQATKFIKY